MNPKTSLAIACLAALALVGCASECQRGQNSGKTLQTRSAACSVFVPITDAEVKACEDNFANCSSADQSKLNTYFDCVDRLPTCASATVNDWNASLQACLNDLNGISTTCFNLFAP